MDKTKLIASYKKNKTASIIIGSSIFVLSTIYLLANRYRAKKITEKIYAKVDAGEGEFGDITDMAWTNPKYLENPPSGTSALYAQTALKHAKDIVAAWGFTGDNEEQVYSVLKKIRTQYQLAQVAKNYEVLTKVNLAYDLKTRLGEDEFQIVNTIITKMPNY